MVMGQPKYIITRVSYQEGSRCPELCSNMLCFHPVGDAKMEAYHEGCSKEVSYSLTWSPILCIFFGFVSSQRPGSEQINLILRKALSYLVKSCVNPFQVLLKTLPVPNQKGG